MLRYQIGQTGYCGFISMFDPEIFGYRTDTDPKYQNVLRSLFS